MLYLQSHAAALHPDGAIQKLLYVSSSSFLVDDVKKQMESALLADKLVAIEFKSYMDLVHKV
tara:strand:- start:467 stop:652 length:186 start_codon:yes stop_codon:yes gene_type:complete